jgi:2-phospho-L-lactate guanylyltransferase
MSLHVVVAVKGLTQGKGRLAGVLAPDQRRRLIVTMLEDVLATLKATSGIAEVSVLTPDATVVPGGQARIDDAGLGLNAAVAHAAQVLALAGVQRMLVLHADLPFATPDDIQALIEAGTGGVAAIAPDATGAGTNALLLSPPGLLQPRFGPRSFAAHLEAARDAGASMRIVRRAGLAHDIDEPADLEALVDRGGARYEFLAHASRRAS